MSILFTLFLAVGLLADWFDVLWTHTFKANFQFLSCILISLLFGFFSELLVAAWRLPLPRVSRWKRSLRHIAINWYLALSVSAIVLLLLAMPILDSAWFLGVVVCVVVLELVAVCSLASLISAKREGHSPTRSIFLRGFGNFALLNLISMVVGVGGGRLYLIIFYPGSG